MVLESLLAIPVFSVALILQSAVLARMPLLMGTTDLALLILASWAIRARVSTVFIWAVVAGVLASFYTALPFGTLPAAYLFVAGAAVLLRRRVWKAPLLSTLAVVFIGTLVAQAAAVAGIAFTGTFLPLADAVNLVVLPSLLLNLLLCVPVYAVVRDLAGLFYAEEGEA